MKRQPKKLSLNRETLAGLEKHEIVHVVGGLSAAATCTCPDICDFSGRATCTTCQVTCTTNFC